MHVRMPNLPLVVKVTAGTALTGHLHVGGASLMSSLMASSAPGPKPQGEQQFSRAVSSARQDMKLSVPGAKSTQQPDSSRDAMLSTSPPFRDHNSSPEEAKSSAAAQAFGDDCGIDLAGEYPSPLYRHSQQSPTPP